jgi:hypothetical protein
VRYLRRSAGRKVLSATALVAAAAAMAAMASAGAYAWRQHTVARLEAAALDSQDDETSEPAEVVMPAPHADAVVDPVRPAVPEPPVATERAKPRALGAAPPPPSCADRFRRANEARREGAVDDAVRLYLELKPACAGTSEEVSSRVLVGRIYLDRLGDPSRALSSFESYLGATSAGSLREDAMIGRALALGKLGRPNDEAGAWRALLAAYPDSLYADKARSRLNGTR